MVQLTRIYTKSGDQGKTSLGDGTKIDKFDVRIEAIGTVDEANAAVGLIHATDYPDINHILKKIQNDLFDCGADLCLPNLDIHKLSIQESHVHFLEITLDHYNQDLSALNSFILPGGSILSSYCHLARTVIRRAERIVCALHQHQAINPYVIKYLNRLSDLMFVLGRYFNNQGKSDILWQPGQRLKDND